MARIAGISEGEADDELKRTYRYMREGMGQLTGRRPERMLEPLQMYAHLPNLLAGYGMLEQATGEFAGLDKRTRALAELKAATITHCEFCIDLGSQIARQWGLHDEELLALPAYRTSAFFSLRDKLVLDCAVGMSRTPVEVSDGLFAALHEQFSAAQLVELTHIIALENMRGRFNLALGIGAAGFSEGMVCAIPANAAPHD